MRLHHMGIQVKSLEASLAFYKKHFGFREIGRLRFGDEDIVFLENEGVCDLPGLKLELIQQENPLQSGVSRIHFAWEVENLKTVIQKLKSLGLEPAEGPYDLKNGWRISFYEGPDQEVIELVEDLDRTNPERQT